MRRLTYIVESVSRQVAVCEAHLEVPHQAIFVNRATANLPRRRMLSSGSTIRL
jgi:hypothetical protein